MDVPWGIVYGYVRVVFTRRSTTDLDSSMVPRRLLRTLAFAGAVLLSATPALAQRGVILNDVPTQVHPGARYLIYLHGRIAEEKGIRPTDERFGVYEYPQILDSLAASGAQVISELRPRGTDFRAFGSHVAEQVRRLLAAGVPAERIAVVGFS